MCFTIPLIRLLRLFLSFTSSHFSIFLSYTHTLSLICYRLVYFHPEIDSIQWIFVSLVRSLVSSLCPSVPLSLFIFFLLLLFHFVVLLHLILSLICIYLCYSWEMNGGGKTVKQINGITNGSDKSSPKILDQNDIHHI